MYEDLLSNHDTVTTKIYLNRYSTNENVIENINNGDYTRKFGGDNPTLVEVREIIAQEEDELRNQKVMMGG